MFKKFSWAHGLIVALGSFIAFILFLIFIYGRHMQTSELVAKDYYEEELHYQDVIDAKNNADKLAEKPFYRQDKMGITISFPNSILPDNKVAEITLFRTDDSNLDVSKKMQLDATNALFIPASVLRKGSYTLKLRWQLAKISYQLDYDVLWNIH